jgi:hypothetical protein
LGPQHLRCLPGSPMRSTGRPLIKTSGEPFTAGPLTRWEQQELPWESLGQCALSPTLQIGGMRPPCMIFNILLL